MLPLTARRIRPGIVSLLIAVGSLLALSAIFAKAAPAAGWHPLALLQWSMLGSALVQSALSGLLPVRTMPTRSVLTYTAMSGLLYAVPNALAFAAARHVGAGFVALCFAFPLVLTYAIAVWLGMDRLTGSKIAGVASGLAGALLLAWQGGLDGGPVPWIAASLAAPVVISLGNIYRSRYWLAGIPASQLSAGMMTCGFATMAIINAALGTPLLPDAPSWQALLLLAGQTALFAILYDLYFRLQKAAGPVYLSQIGSVGAAVGLVLAYLAFGEVPGPFQAAALPCIALGVVLVSRRRDAGNSPR